MSFYANRRKGIFNFLKLSQQNNDENQDNLEPDLETNLESDWEEAAQEFGSEPISEEKYLESVSLDPEFGRQKYMLTWLSKNGIKIFKDSNNLDDSIVLYNYLKQKNVKLYELGEAQ